ncbi:helix-turn-helix domain-containing protein [Microtetraspora fusca]|uniref:Helix-turn-helix domain-containing protein n=1 Tax=Microtetraspora fusca TaxID=1997 RepID=A0ABW6VFJ4_MICFU
MRDALCGLGSQAVVGTGEQKRQAGPHGGEPGEDGRLVEAGPAQVRLGEQQAQWFGQERQVRPAGGRGRDRDATADEASVVRLRDAVCDLLRQYWEIAVKPMWPQMRLVLEADMTYRARQLAVGGARLLFAGMHPSLRWHDGVLHIDKMISHHRVAAAGRGLLLMPSVFAHKPAPPLSPEEPPSLVYPSRGVATLWTAAPATDEPALVSLLGPPRARLLRLLEEPLPTAELARRLRATPSAVSQHLRVLYATGLVTRARDGRQVLYRRSSLGDRLAGVASRV